MLSNRKPMSRGQGFKRPEFVRATPPAPTRGRGGVLANCEGRAAPKPKPEAHRNAHLLAMARGKPCLFRVDGVCNFNPDTTVAAHSNWACHGKSGARKADDQYSAWCCSACHSWLDQGRADGELKKTAFMLAHLSQVDEWRHIAMLASSAPADRRAAQWALEHLNATPTGQLENR